MSTITPEASTPESQQVTTRCHPLKKQPWQPGDPCLAFLIFAGSNQDSATVVKAILGLLLGVTLFHSRFGFTSAWRQLISVGQGRALQAHMLMLAVAVVGFSIVISNGNGFFDSQPAGYVAPITLGLLIGSFLFGLGMQLGGSCASGTLYATGSGHIGVLVTLIGFVAGSGVGVAHSGFWSSAGNGFVKLADPFSFSRHWSGGRNHRACRNPRGSGAWRRAG